MHELCFGTNGRVVMVRLLPGSDLIQSMKKIAEENNISCGYIVTCIGSLESASFVYPIPKEDSYFNMVYSEAINLKGPVEFLGGQGIFAKDEEGEFQIHLHGSLSDGTMRVYGGHILNEGNIVLATIDLVIQELEGVDLKRTYHKESGIYFFTPSSKKEE
ncbi:hypothetical protein SAMN05446037_100482 [Anaerovirgula multivorans]|uniref:PPC domain-containing protein n=1 Tax=Anaerovirgula multivorans TaxID=312168 RepID=A0A239BS86_9FIRM|nr:PPC domain-containing DNA-binding protein [Anaerovirgula multivorans]SNS10278.1 hypothetical protein SAMN05446037_100482 [Anaerovirgula multivorans]